MQNPETILGILELNSKREGYKFKDLYRILYNTDMYLNAYSKLYPKQGNMTAGTDGLTIDGFSTETIEQIICELKTESYKPKPVRRVYIPKANGKSRPLGIPSFKDKLLQEVVRQILDSIYEPRFQDTSHGFRPNKSCKTILTKIQRKCSGTKWWIEGDIKGFFDNIDHHVLIGLLRKTIEDERFIRLIWKFLKAGYIDDWKYNQTYSGTPQGGIISPILSNIYLNELDCYMESLKEKYTTGVKRRPSTEYRTIQARVYRARKKLKKHEYSSEDEKKELINKIKENSNLMRKMESKEPLDGAFRRFHYFRYADDFLIAFIGSKKEAEEIKRTVFLILQNELKLELSLEKTLITNTKNRIRFLGYDIAVSKSEDIKRTSNGKIQRHLKGTVQLLLPHEKMRDFLLKTKTMKIINGEEWKAIPRVNLTSNDDLEILTTFNSEIRGFYNYYEMANDVHKLHHAFGVFKRSYLKTLGHKYRTKATKMRKEKKSTFFVNGEWGITYTNNKGVKVFRPFYNDGFTKREAPTTHIDTFPSGLRNAFRTSLLDRIRAKTCEWCGTQNGNFEVHHVRKLKDLKLPPLRKRHSKVRMYKSKWMYQKGINTAAFSCIYGLTERCLMRCSWRKG